MEIFGQISLTDRMQAERALAHPDNMMCLMFDKAALGKQHSIEKTLALLPKPVNQSSRFDLWLLMTECMANAHMHCQTETLAVAMRYRAGVNVMPQYGMIFWHHPALPPMVAEVIEKCKQNWLPKYESHDYQGSGLGYPLLTRLCKEISLSPNRRELSCWLQAPISLAKPTADKASQKAIA